MSLPKIEPILARNGDVSGIWKGICLHSRIDPRREANRAVAESLPAKGDGIVVFGFGLGYHVEAILSRFPHSKVWVVEPDEEFLRSALETRDCSVLLANPRVKLFTGDLAKIQQSLVKELEETPFLLYRYRPAVEMNQSVFQSLEKFLQKLTSRKQVNLNTLSRFGKLWVRNLSRNFGRLCSLGGIELLQGLFSSYPALVVAAGPSLDEVLPHLPALSLKFLVVAVDTSYNPCVRSGVEPDFVVVMDPQYWNTRHLDRALQRKARLVSEPSTHPAIFRRLPGKTFLAGSLFPLGRYMEQHTGKRKALGAGGSVSTSAWDLARILGCDPIVCAGLDLSFPNRRTHCRGSFFEERCFSLRTRFRPEELYFFQYLRDANPRYMPANDGGMVLTDQRMLVYQDWFETQCKLHPEVRTRTLSLKGLKIEGIDCMSLEEALGYPDCREALQKKLEWVDALPVPSFDAEKAQRGIAELLKGLETLEELAREGLGLVEKIRTQYQQTNQIDVEPLNEIDEKIMTNQYKDIAGFLLAGAIQRLQQGEETNIEQVLLNSEMIYRALLDSIHFHKRHLTQPKNYQDFVPESDDFSGGSLTTL